MSYHEGLGKYKNKLGKIRCKLKNGKKFFCGSGFNDSEREMVKFKNGKIVEVKKDPNFPKIGEEITFKCMEIIKKTGTPRMAVYCGVRHDLK